MVLPNFGIPDEAASLQAVQEQVAANNALLQRVATAALTPVAQTITDNAAGLNKVGSTLKRSLTGTVRAGQGQLDKVGGTLSANIASAIGAAQTQLTQALQLPAPPGELTNPQQPGGPQQPQTGTVYTQASLPILDPQSVLWTPGCPFTGQTPIQLAPVAEAVWVWIRAGVPPYYDAYFATQAECAAYIQSLSPEQQAVCNVGQQQPQPVQPPPAQAEPPPPAPIGQEPLGPGEPTPPPDEQPPEQLPPPAEDMPDVPDPTGTTIPPPQAFQCRVNPRVGSADWCKGIDTYIRDFANVGNAVFDWLDNQLDPDALLGALEAKSDPGLFSSISGKITAYINNLLRLVHKISRGWVSSLRKMLKGWRTIAECYMSCDPASILGIQFARSLLKVFHNLRAGTDALVWATVDVRLEVDQLDRTVQYLCDYLCPVEVPAIADTMEAFLANQISDEQAKCWLSMRGADWDVWFPVLYARREKLDPRELIEWGRRHDLSDHDIAAQLRLYGYLDSSDAEQQVEMYDEIPSIADHLHWLQRNVFDDKYVEDFGLMDGFEDRFWAKFGKDLRTKGMKKDYAALHYAAHWLNPAPGQLLEMVYRLRPDKDGVQHPFTLDDYVRVLTEQDTNAYFRARFGEIAYRVPALGYLRDMFRQGVIDEAALKSYHQDLGYSPDDSERFVSIDSIQKARFRATQAHGWTPVNIAKAWQTRQILRTDVVDYMAKLGYTAEQAHDLMDVADSNYRNSIILRARSRAMTAAVKEVRAALATGIMTVQQAAQSLQSLGWTAEQANGLAQSELTAGRVSLIKSTVGAIKRAYLQGEIDLQYATQALQNIGIVPQALASYLALWQIANTPGRKRRTAKEIVGDVASGHLNTDEAYVRLTNLGYSDADSRLYLADARQKIVTAQAKMKAAAVKGQHQADKEMAAVVKAQERQLNALRSAFKKQAPPAKLQKWATLGLLTAGDFKRRMALYGYADDAIDKWWDEACKAKTAACAEGEAAKVPAVTGETGISQSGGAAAPAAKPVPGSGGGLP